MTVRRTASMLLAAIVWLGAAPPGGHPGGGRPGPAPAARSAPAPAARAGGFDLRGEVPAPAHVTAARPAPVGRSGPQSPALPPNRRVTEPVMRAQPGRVANRAPIANPHYRGQAAWSWNHGIAWQAAPVYWGGGFWGAFALGALAGVALDGSYADPGGTDLPSYVVAPDSPGADLLASYGLTQTSCSGSGLVVIYGPDQSVICAEPNAQVAPGQYTVDPSGLTLEPAA